MLIAHRFLIIWFAIYTRSKRRRRRADIIALIPARVCVCVCRNWIEFVFVFRRCRWMAAMDGVGGREEGMEPAHKIKRDAFTLLRTRLRCMALVIKIYEMVRRTESRKNWHSGTGRNEKIQKANMYSAAVAAVWQCVGERCVRVRGIQTKCYTFCFAAQPIIIMIFAEGTRTRRMDAA